MFACDLGPLVVFGVGLCNLSIGIGSLLVSCFLSWEFLVELALGGTGSGHGMAALSLAFKNITSI